MAAALIRAIGYTLAMSLIASCANSQMQTTHRTPVSRVIAEELPPLEPVGYAGLYVGETGGLILAAGGTNFPGDPPWKSGKKVWYDHVSVCDGRTWRVAGKLPKPMAMGVAVTTPRGVLIVGGGDEDEVFDDVLLLKLVGNDVKCEALPAFPKKLMAASGVLIGSRVYVVGGHSDFSPLAQGPLAEVWSMDLNDASARWRSELPIPAEGRWLPVVGTDGKSLLVLSGFARAVDDQKKPFINCLKDVWKLTPGSDGAQWKRLADLPRANAAAPSPSPFVAGELLLMGGGVDNSNFGGPMEKRPPFLTTITAVDTTTGRSRIVGEVKSSVVAAHSAPWKGGCAIISGEIRAGVRTPANWLYRFE
jgi:N-acetylneuraminic acid mutarotase